MHNLVVSCLVVAYLSSNVYAIVKVRMLELTRSRKQLVLYVAPFILWGSLILLGCKLMEIMRRFDGWAAGPGVPNGRKQAEPLFDILKADTSG